MDQLFLSASINISSVTDVYNKRDVNVSYMCQLKELFAERHRCVKIIRIQYSIQCEEEGGSGNIVNNEKAINMQILFQ